MVNTATHRSLNKLYTNLQKIEASPLFHNKYSENKTGFKLLLKKKKKTSVTVGTVSATGVGAVSAFASPESGRDDAVVSLPSATFRRDHEVTVTHATVVVVPEQREYTVNATVTVTVRIRLWAFTALGRSDAFLTYKQNTNITCLSPRCITMHIPSINMAEKVSSVNDK